MIQPVFLAGGKGTRLWPLSRELFPKQLLPLSDEGSMLQATARRLSGRNDLLPAIVLCHVEHRFMVAEQLRAQNAPIDAIILEPESRNTAPALFIAALRATADGNNPVLLIMPADHAISDTDAFLRAVNAGLPHAEDGKLVTLGIAADRPETGYGYIRKGEALNGAWRIDQFLEKPPLKDAETFVASGEYFWNTGILLFRASVLLAEAERLAPDLLAKCRLSLDQAAPDLDFIRLKRKPYGEMDSMAIDYAIMEKTESGVVVELEARWRDLGSWKSLGDAAEPDDAGNVLVGDVLTHDVSDSYLHATRRLMAVVGLKGVVCVETPDAMLVVDKTRTQDVKEIVRRLKADKRAEAVTHHQVFRPWGSYESLVCQERFQVKRIIVKPGQKLSLQRHNHRAEHWIVVRGTARVTRGDDVFLLSEDQSTYIPIGTTHRLENPGRIPLELIEVQSGSYLGEDDIERMDDVYGRVEDNGG